MGHLPLPMIERTMHVMQIHTHTGSNPAPLPPDKNTASRTGLCASGRAASCGSPCAGRAVAAGYWLLAEEDAERCWGRVKGGLLMACGFWVHCMREGCHV
eukprot:scaffold214133_cov22-Tisochrysis_lutea.AAC.1